MPRKSFIALWKHYRAHFILSISLFVCIVSFQNCSPQMDVEEGSSDVSSLSDTTPFAFDVSIDHFAMMSCNTQNLTHKRPNGQFTYKWGAYQNGRANPGLAGLRLSDKFMSQYGRNVSAKIFTVLEDSEKNKNLEITSGLYIPRSYKARQGDHKTTALRSDHSNLQVNSFRMDLSLNPKETLAYFPGASISTGLKRSIEGTVFRRTLDPKTTLVGSYKDEFTAMVNFDQLRSYPLAIGFGHAAELAKGEAKSLIGEDGGYSNESAIGRSYLPHFTGLNSSHLRYLSGITEESLDGSSSFSSWGCPADLRLKVVQRKDIEDGRVTCNPTFISSAALRSQDIRGRNLRSIANILDLSVWEVDLTNRCIVRRGDNSLDNCYITSLNPYVNAQGQIESTQVVKVDYSSNQSICSSSDPIRNEPRVSGGLNKKTLYICPHYVSICVKFN